MPPRLWAYSWANTPMPPFSGIMMYGPAVMPGADRVGGVTAEECDQTAASP